MLLKNITHSRLDSAVVGVPKIDNYFDEKKPKKAKAMKVKKSPYGGDRYGYYPVGMSANPSSETSVGDGGDGGD